jgi:hypothetical protein
MTAAQWEDLKEEICTQLFFGKENGEDEPDTMARILWLERHSHLTLTISERLQQFYNIALETVEKPVTSLVDRERGADSGKGKLLKWKTRSRSIGHLVFLILRARRLGRQLIHRCKAMYCAVGFDFTDREGVV